ncbi:14631_t:CDS:2 [Gigaspora margarita]|uniref:14631_t:CDS:1 n=1 Tax=Gigaspora margarita TaxID=4874 RepID=A0ABN7V9N2_GIGMA|nr:14631_t:CDS:2 [Gigaspora margarita]
MLEGVVEIDETLIGGANPNRHWNKKVPRCQVLGILERNGNLVCQVVPNTKQNTLEPIIETYVKKVNHSAKPKQYVNGEITTNSIESAWACLKRSIYGIYHQVSKEHLPKYVNEFTFRFNTRKHKVQETVELVLLSSVGKSLTYRELVN